MPRPTHMWLALSLTAAAIAPVAGQVFRGQADLVRVPVVVLDKHGTPVPGLKRDDFEVREDGHPQDVTFFAAGAPGPDVPLHLGLMLDRSESMELDLAATSTAAVRFLGAVDEAADVTLVEFDTTVRVSRFSPADYPRLFARIRDGKLGQQTALYDAIGRYVETTHGRPGQHILLVYTDGGDSARGLTAADVEMLLRQGDVMVYILGYVEHLEASERARQQGILTQLARDTGGEAFFPSSVRDVSAVYARIRAEIASRYTLGYVSSDAARDGRFRRIDVRLRAPADPAVRVRARNGYLAPE